MAVGGATRDITFFTDRAKVLPVKDDPTFRKAIGFEYGAKINIEKSLFTFGGGACNTSTTFRNMGLATGILARIGRDDNGKAILADLERKGVNTELVQTDKTANTGFSFIVGMEKTREHTAFLHRGANNFLELGTYNLERLNTKWIYISSLSGRNWGKPLSAISDLVSSPTSSLQPPPSLAWNPGNAQLSAGKTGLSAFLEKTAVLIVNRDEATELVISDKSAKPTPTKLGKMQYLLETLASWGPEVVAITSGAKGAHILADGTVYKAGMFDSERVDTTGAGDAFGSGLTAGLILYGGNVEKALRLAMVNSGSVITQIGAQKGLPKRKAAEKHLSEVKIEIK